MDTALSDLLTCPRCGPGYGLVLLPTELREGRVEAGVLGCANCRERFEVARGVADLRVGAGGGEVGESASDPGSESASTPAGVGDAGEEAVRLAALLGLAEGGGTVVVAGPSAAVAGRIREVVEGVSVVSVVSVTGSSGIGARGGVGVSRLLADVRIPLREGALRGVALTGEWASRLEEGARLVSGAGRLVVEPAPADARERLEAVGMDVLLEQDGVVVAARGR